MLVCSSYVGFAFVDIAARTGAGVTMLNYGKRAPAGFDPDLVAMTRRSTTPVFPALFSTLIA